MYQILAILAGNTGSAILQNVHQEPNLTFYLTIQWWENWLQKCKKKVIILYLRLAIGIGKILSSIIGYCNIG